MIRSYRYLHQKRKLNVNSLSAFYRSSWIVSDFLAPKSWKTWMNDDDSNRRVHYSKSSNSVHLCPKNTLCYSQQRYLYQGVSQKLHSCEESHEEYFGPKKLINHAIEKPHCLYPHYSRTPCIALMLDNFTR